MEPCRRVRPRSRKPLCSTSRISSGGRFARKNLSGPSKQRSHEANLLTADIDIGRTLTDGIFIDGQKLECVKVDTTPHDLTVCLFECLTEGATQLGYADVDAFLENLELIRWSTTITSNVLAESRGPRIGLLISRGHEKNLYGQDAHSVVLKRLLSERDVIGVDDSTSETEI